MECTKVPPGGRKVKKKPVKDELDRLKQAEKKKRRLEKALATSAAIRSELEKKKQKKKEEQQRLDEEGAAIAEAVALNVLLGEDSEDSHKIMLNDEGFGPWDCASSIDLLTGGTRVVVPHHELAKHTLGGIEWVPYAHGSGYEWNEWENGHISVSPRPFVGELYTPYSEERGWDTTEISADHIAAQAVASLQIAEDAHVDSYVYNGMLQG